MKKRKIFSIFFTILTVFAFFKPQKKILGWGRKIHIFTTSEAQMTHFSWNFFRTKSVLKLVRVSTTLGTWKNPPKNSDTWSALYNHIVPSTCTFYLSRTVIMIDLRPLRSDDTHRSERSWPSETDEMLTGRDELGLEGLLDSPFCLFLSIFLQSSRQVDKHSLSWTKSAFWTVHLSKCQSVTELTTAGPTCAGFCLRTGCFN